MRPPAIEHLLEPFRFREDDAEDARLRRFLDERALPPPVEPEGIEPGTLQVALARRGEAVQELLGAHYRARRQALETEAPHRAHAYETLHAHTRLLDALHRAAFDAAWADLPALLDMRRSEWRGERDYCAIQLRDKTARLEEFRQRMPREFPDGERERAYYAGIEESLVRERDELAARGEAMADRLTALERFTVDREAALRRLLVFARGGYGRAELGFASDLDTGYCVDPAGLPPGGAEPYREVILRMETLLRGSGLDTAHQYFEIDEDLERFTRPETQHTVTSVLEGRAVLGAAGLMDALKDRFRDLLPFERFAPRKLHELMELPEPDPAGVRVKSDAGGLRTIQAALWLLAHAEGAEDWSSAAILALGVERGLVSVQEAHRLCQALELFQDIRNTIAPPFVTGAGATPPPEGSDGQRFDAAARLHYLERRGRFAHPDDLERHFRRVVADVRELASRLVSRVLDRTAIHEVAGLCATVHLLRDEIVSLEPLPDDATPLRAHLQNVGTLLELLVYSAESGYRLAPTLLEGLGRDVPALEADPAGVAPALHRMLVAPFAHRAVWALFAINTPVAHGVETLMGRVLPACDGAYYLVRGPGGTGRPLHERMGAALEQGQRRLEAFRAGYPEWAGLLAPHHEQALKWSLLLHPLNLLEGEGDDHARSAELAVATLEAAGEHDERLAGLVRLLVENQEALLALTRASRFVDLALAEYFELAQRDVATAILLYLVNAAVREAEERDGGSGAELEDLTRLFDEAMRILASLRAIPASERTIELINLYFDGRKEETERDTRLFLLARRVVTQGPAAGLRMPGGEGPEPELPPGVIERLEPLYRRIVLGRHGPGERERLVARLAQTLQQELDVEHARALTAGSGLDWFFAGFPNRYLLRTPPAVLGQQVAKFAEYAERPVLVEVVEGEGGLPAELLVAVHGLEHPHSRVAYALALRRLNILSGKINRVLMPDGRTGFCYWFQVSAGTAELARGVRDLEALILQPPPAEGMPRLPVPPTAHEATSVRVLGDDGRGYLVTRQDGRYARRGMPFAQLRVTRHDEPFLFYGLCRVFDAHDVDLQQAVITTTGNLVVDSFYLEQAELARLADSTLIDDIVRELDAREGAAE